jgi:hypothetical protein
MPLRLPVAETTFGSDISKIGAGAEEHFFFSLIAHEPPDLQHPLMYY